MILPRTSTSAIGHASDRLAADRELALVIACVRAVVDSDGGDRIRTLAGSGLDWTRVLALATRHGLRALLERHLRRLEPAHVPAETMAALHAHVQARTTLSLAATGHLLRLVDAMNATGLVAMPFKGPALAHELYGHVALRDFADLDILVRGRDVWRASAMLEAHGFVAAAEIPEARRADVVRDDCVRLFRRDEPPTIVELHWSLARRASAVRFDEDAFWRRVRSFPLHGRTVLAPSHEDLLLALCIQGARHAWDRLERLASVAELIRLAPVDWAYVSRQADLMHCRRMVALALLLASTLFETPLPDDFRGPGDGDPLRSMAAAIASDLHPAPIPECP